MNAQQSFPVNSLPPCLEAPGRARIGASTRLWPSGTWSIDHPEADPAPPGGGTAVHSLSLPPRPTLERIVRYVAARGAAEGTTRFGALLGGAKF